MDYIAEKDGIRFYVSPDSFQIYADQGYKIYKLVKEEIKDVEKETEKAKEQMTQEVSTSVVKAEETNE